MNATLSAVAVNFGNSLALVGRFRLFFRAVIATIFPWGSSCTAFRADFLRTDYGVEKLFQNDSLRVDWFFVHNTAE